MANAPLDLADQDSWPAAVREELARSLGMLCAFEIECRAIDRRMRENVLVRINPPDNPHAAERAALIASIDTAVEGGDILAWHCTRLLPHESASITDGGLRRHGRALFEERIAAAVAEGHLPEAVSTALLANGQVEDVGRDKLLHLILNRHVLADEPDVGDLLRNWGGEAIYNNAGRGRSDSDLRIGEAAIVEAVLPIGWLEDLPWSIGAQMVLRFCDLNGIVTEHRWGSNAKLRRDLPPAMVRRVIGPSDEIVRDLDQGLGLEPPGLAQSLPHFAAVSGCSNSQGSTSRA